MQDRAHRRFDVARNVGMPDLAGDVLRRFVGLDQQDFGVPLDRAPAAWMDVQLAELAAEVGMLVDAELLVTKEITRLSISASWISWNCWLPSGLVRSTPRTSAPITGATLRTSMVW
jgi:hypothetical protein